mmetsp:Transcript_6900/g.10938  ORF Transcript_6900/g.10938 Transcript_6900/m.10938 type:complete len:366 (+) Transcript_6900:1319-2416(+)
MKVSELKRMPVPSDLAKMLQAESYLVDRYLHALEAMPRIWEDTIGELNWRFNFLQMQGLYYAAPEKRIVVWSDVRIAQAEMGRIHGLAYHNAGNRSSAFYRPETDIEDVAFDTRSKNHFTQIFNSGDPRNILRLDIALLAHVFQVPIPVMETHSRDVFTDYVREIVNHVQLFGTELEFLEAMSASAPQLLVVHSDEIEHYLPEPSRETARGFRIIEAPNLPSELDTDRPIVAHANLKDQLGPRAGVVMIGRADGKWQLLSTDVMLGSQVEFDAARLTVPALPVMEKDAARLQISTPGEFDVVLIAADRPLDGFPAFIRNKRALARDQDDASILTTQDWQWIRETLFALGPKKTHVLFRKLDVQKA